MHFNARLIMPSLLNGTRLRFMQVRATEDTRLVSMPAEAYDAMWPHKENHYWYVRFLRDLPGFQKVASRTIALVYYTLSEKECTQGTKVVEQVRVLAHTPSPSCWTWLAKFMMLDLACHIVELGHIPWHRIEALAI